MSAHDKLGESRLLGLSSAEGWFKIESEGGLCWQEQDLKIATGVV